MKYGSIDADIDELLKLAPDSKEDLEDSELEDEDKTTFKPSQIQTPLKGTFWSSGGFSFSPTDARHPKGHLGVDMRTAGGTPVFPMAPGVVTDVGSNPAGGNTVNVLHNLKKSINDADQFVRTYYAHLSSISVHVGDKVDNNTVLGAVGDSGSAKGTMPHLHFQVWNNCTKDGKNGTIQNPTTYFEMPKYTNFDKTKEKRWLSNEAEQISNTFDVKKHVMKGKMAHSKYLDNLIKLAGKFERLANEY